MKDFKKIERIVGAAMLGYLLNNEVRKVVPVDVMIKKIDQLANALVEFTVKGLDSKILKKEIINKKVDIDLATDIIKAEILKSENIFKDEVCECDDCVAKRKKDSKIKEITEEKIEEEIKNITDSIKSKFPNSTIKVLKISKEDK
jgi:hypothetical protein